MAHFDLLSAWIVSIGSILALVYFALRNRSEHYVPKQSHESGLQELALALSRVGDELDEANSGHFAQEDAPQDESHPVIMACR